MALEGKEFSHYRILRLIGKGGMGEVYLAEDTQVQRQVAAKVVLIEEGQLDQETLVTALRLFQREARVIARLDHPAILPLYDHGETSLEALRFTYLIMPYRPEGSLTSWIRQRGYPQRLTPQQISYLLQQAGQALQYAHDHQIMHLDIKPANFLIRSLDRSSDFPDLLLCDFGIARLASSTTSSSQGVRGTPVYMAPEQWANRPVYASDQYALAIMTYELLTGSPPFKGLPMNVMVAHLQEQPASVCDRNELLPPAVDPVMQRALAKKPEERFPTIVEFVRAFQEALDAGSDRRSQIIQTPAPLPPAVHNASAPSHTFQLLQPLPAAPVFPLTQEALITAAPHQVRSAFDPVTFVSVIPEPVALFPQPSAPSLLPAASRQPQHRRLRLVRATIVLLLLLVLLGATGLGIYVMTRQLTAQPQGSATTRPHVLTTIQARETATAITLAAGTTWQAQHYPASSNIFVAVTWGDSQFVAVAKQGVVNVIMTSPDGHVWTPRPIPPGDDISSVTWGDSQFVAVGKKGSAGVILTSPDGHIWTPRQHPSTATIFGVTWGGSQFVAVGEDLGAYYSVTGVILTSPDGRTWMPRQVPGKNNNSLSGVAWGDSQFVVWADNSTPSAILTSSDGRTWISRSLPADPVVSISSVTWGDSQFVAVGKKGSTGVILTSPDGQTWTSQQLPVSDDLTGVTWGDSQFVAVGDAVRGNNIPQGVILTSPDGQMWTPQQVPGIDEYDTLLGVTWGDSQFVVVGDNIGYYATTAGTVLTSP